jgi:4-amino-4-deoxy-L-arabinose transferase-like glycosyltransferase
MKFMKKFWQKNSRGLSFWVKLLFFWQVGLTAVALLSGLVIAPREGFVYTEFKKTVNPPLFWSRANFDGIHYLGISRGGYGLYQQAFFPFYPKLISFFRPFFAGRDLLAAIFISGVCLAISIWLLYRLTRFDFGEEVARCSTVFLLLFPTAFFFGLAYTESLFLALVLGSFLAARRKRWFLAGALGALASYTRLVGIFLLPALVWEWWEQNKGKGLKHLIHPKALGLGLIPLGLLAFMRYLWLNYQDPLLFVHVQPFFGAERSGGRVILLYQVFWRYFRMILTTKADPLYFAVWLELLTMLGFIFLLFWAYKKKVRGSYLVFSLFALILPTLSGTLSSMPRYVLVVFPGFIALGTIKSTKLRGLFMLGFGLLSLVAAGLFFQGYWVS